MVAGCVVGSWFVVLGLWGVEMAGWGGGDGFGSGLFSDDDLPIGGVVVYAFLVIVVRWTC